jgi:PAS domain S-box-containing protein
MLENHSDENGLVREGLLSEIRAYLNGTAFPPHNDFQVALRESEERFRALVDSAPVAVGISRKGRTLFVNQAFADLFGYSQPAELVGMPLILFIAPSEREKIADYIHRREAKEDVPTRYESVALRKDGSTFPYLAQIGLITLHGEPTTVGYFIDIAQQKRVEFEQRILVEVSEVLASELDYQKTLDAFAKYIVPTLADLCIVDLLDMNGQSIRQVIVEHAQPHIQQHVLTLHQDAFSDLNSPFPSVQALCTGESVLIENLDENAVSADDSLRLLQQIGICSCAFIPLKARGRTVGVLNLHTDAESGRRFTPHDLYLLEQIAQRAALAFDNALLYDSMQQAHQQAEQARQDLAFLNRVSALLSSSLNYRHALDQLARIVVPKMAQWSHIDILQADNSIKRLAVAHVEPDKEHLLYELNKLFPSDLSATRGAGKVIRTGEPDYMPIVPAELIEAYANRPRHYELMKQFDVRSYIIVPLTARGRTFGAMTFATSTDMCFTERDLHLAQELANMAALSIDNAYLFHQERDAVQQAHAAIRARDEFLSIAAHELKTPITSINGFTQLLLRQISKKGALNTEQLPAFLERLQGQSSKLSVLVNQLLDISSLDGGRLAISPTLTPLVKLIAQVIQLRRELSPKHTIDLVAPVECTLLIDPIRMEQVITNLLDNAVKFSPEGTMVCVSVQTDDHAVTVTVQDQGVGVPEGQRDKLFQRFFRAETGRYFQGLGLGLYICQQIIELHSGTITAQFPDSGGTTMIITLPRDRHL